jgi:hypothetical protein
MPVGRGQQLVVLQIAPGEHAGEGIAVDKRDRPATVERRERHTEGAVPSADVENSFPSPQVDRLEVAEQEGRARIDTSAGEDRSGEVEAEPLPVKGELGRPGQEELFDGG